MSVRALALAALALAVLAPGAAAEAAAHEDPADDVRRLASANPWNATDLGAAIAPGLDLRSVELVLNESGLLVRVNLTGAFDPQAALNVRVLLSDERDALDLWYDGIGLPVRADREDWETGRLRVLRVPATGRLQGGTLDLAVPAIELGERAACARLLSAYMLEPADGGAYHVDLAGPAEAPRCDAREAPAPGALPAVAAAAVAACALARRATRPLTPRP